MSVPDPAVPEHRTRGWRLRFAHFRAGTRLIIALVSSIVTAIALRTVIGPEMCLVAAWDGFALVALILTWLTILTLRPEQICVLAQREDNSRFVSLVLVVMGASASLLAVVLLLQSSMSMQVGERYAAITLALSAVALGWLLIHTVFTLRYAHLYYDGGKVRDIDSAALAFPGDETSPDYLDFAYFAFVIGMTAQTSDTAIKTRHMRRTALLHGIISFAFNTAIVALSIGVLTGLLAK